VKKIAPKMWPNPFLSQSMDNPKNVGYFRTFQKTTQSKQSPKGRKLAQSGHPVI
jgi:hypothetical protein